MPNLYGKICFDAHVAYRKSRDLKDRQLPTWEEMPPEIQAAWNAGAIQAIIVAQTANDPFMALRVAYHVLLANKPQDRSEVDRFYAIAITKLQDVLAHFKTWIVDGGIE